MRPTFWQGTVIGTLRRECLDHMIVVNEGSLRRQIASYIEYSPAPAVTYRSGKTPRTEEPLNRRNSGALSRFPRWVVFIIDTSDVPPEPASRVTGLPRRTAPT